MENKSHVPNHQPVTILAPFKGMLQISALGIVFFWTVVCDPIPLSQQNTESTPTKKSMGGCL